MKAKTSVTLETDLLARIDSVLHINESRSAFFTDAARQLAEKRERSKRDSRDSDLLSANAAALNQEAQEDSELVADLFRACGEAQP